MADKNKVEDIFDEVDKNSTPDKKNQLIKSKTVPPVQPQKLVQRSTKSAGSTMPLNKSKMPLVILIVFVIVVLAGIIYLVLTGTLSDLIKDNNQDSGVNSTSGEQVNVNDKNSENTSTDTASSGNFNINDIDIGEPDTDGDGLTDAEENSLGTNPNSVDSDSDQLFDRTEVKIYKTDPLNPDTDNDGQLDGVEVKNGYDPNGPGLLLDLQKEINNLEN